jgi:hypothetical protein
MTWWAAFEGGKLEKVKNIKDRKMSSFDHWLGLAGQIPFQIVQDEPKRTNG